MCLGFMLYYPRAPLADGMDAAPATDSNNGSASAMAEPRRNLRRSSEAMATWLDFMGVRGRGSSDRRARLRR